MLRTVNQKVIESHKEEFFLNNIVSDDELFNKSPSQLCTRSLVSLERQVTYKLNGSPVKEEIHPDAHSQQRVV